MLRVALREGNPYKSNQPTIFNKAMQKKCKDQGMEHDDCLAAARKASEEALTKWFIEWQKDEND